MSLKNSTGEYGTVAVIIHRRRALLLLLLIVAGIRAFVKRGGLLRYVAQRKGNNMKTKIHAIAGAVGFLTILVFWTSTLATELVSSHAVIV
jgi:uncharacterized iron-regulated membrane protein